MKITDKDYALKLAAMEKQLQAWRRANPELPVLVLFRIPAKLWLAASLDDAIKQKFLIVDYNGKRMLKELGWLDDNRDQPTVMMVKMVIEHAKPSV
mgnify:CR=1 FL=1